MIRALFITLALLLSSASSYAQSPIARANSSDPTWTNGNPAPLSVDLSGYQRSLAKQTGTWTVQPGNTPNTSPWLVTISQGGIPAVVTASGALKVDLSATASNANPLAISASSLPLPALAATSTKQSDGSQKTQVVDGSGNVVGATGNALDVNIKSGFGSSIQVTQGTNPWAVSAASLPLPSNAAQETGGNLASTATNTNTSNTNLGAPGATACATDTGSCSLNALLQRLAQRLTSVISTLGTPLQAGGNVVVTSAPSTAVTNAGTFAVQAQPTPVTSGGLSVYFVQPAASDNHANIKNGAGQVYKISVTNNSATINYLRLYNAGTGFNGCNSATNLVYQMAIPASASSSGAGYSDSWESGIAFATGISICVTSGYATTDTTNATASALSVNVGYK